MTHVDPSQLVVGAPVVTSDATVTVDASVTNPVDPGDHVFQLIVVDENGVESTPVEQRVTISPDDRKPQAVLTALPAIWADRDRKSTRLNSSHSQISYAVFCLK